MTEFVQSIQTFPQAIVAVTVILVIGLVIGCWVWAMLRHL